MKGLDEQLEAKRRHWVAERAAASAADAEPREAHEARERAERLAVEIAELGMECHLGEAAHGEMAKALARLEDLPTHGRELALAKTYLETAIWRLRNHLGQPL